jgi:hypothetical protein
MSGFGRVPEYSEEWGEAFLAAMHDYLETLETSLEGDDLDNDVETISGEPFCGCADCYEREMYLMATKLVVEGYESGKVRLVDGDG